ncbi:hypothetical protein [Actinomadura monticuli]|uniref:Uncharacterized protein n=1 Tax=Actinomadura monticuli TaxID=3097367 RepID=A0ABV4Q4E8_9ACTN
MDAVPGREQIRGVGDGHLLVQLPAQQRRQLGAPEVVGAADRGDRAKPEPAVGAVLESPGEAEGGRGALREAGGEDPAVQDAPPAGREVAGGPEHVQ